MHDGWMPTTLGDIAFEVRDSVAPKDMPDAPYLGLEHLAGGNVKPIGVGRSGDTTSNKFRFEAGDVVFGRLRPYLRKMCQPDFEGVCSTEFTVLRPRQSKEVLPEFLGALMQSERIWSHATAIAKGTRMPRAAWKDMAQLAVTVPPLPVQQRIVDLIDHIDQQVAALSLQSERATTALSVCSQELNMRVDTMSLRELASVAEVVMGQSPRGSDCNRSGEGEPLLNGPTEFTDLLVADPKQWTTDGKRHAATGDVLLCVRGATAGRINVARYPTAIGRGLAAIRGETPAHTKYIRHMLAANLNSLLDGASGTIFPNISSARLREVAIPWPDDTLLRRFSGAFDAMERVATHSRDGWLKLVELRSQVLTSLLSGDHEIPESYDRFLEEQGAA